MKRKKRWITKKIARRYFMRFGGHWSQRITGNPEKGFKARLMLTSNNGNDLAELKTNFRTIPKDSILHKIYSAQWKETHENPNRTT